MIKAFKTSLMVASIAVLAACGGGEEAPANPIAKYAGTYYSECSLSGDVSAQNSVKINDLGAGNFSFESYQSAFNDGACSLLEESMKIGSGTITLVGSEKFKFSNFEGVLPQSICATKNEEVSIDLVRVDYGSGIQGPATMDFYFYKINSYLFVLEKDDSESWSGSAFSTDPNYSTDNFIDCSAPPA